MTNPNHFPQNPDLSLPFVDEATILQFEKSEPEVINLYDERFRQNERLALWVRRRAIEIEPDNLEKREQVASLAFEALKITDNQTAIDGLVRSLDGDIPSNAEQPRDVPVQELPPAA